MKKNLFFVFLSCLLYTVLLHGEIAEIKQLKELKSHLKPNTLIVFDCDNVLIEPKQLLGSDQWGSYQINKYQKMGLSKEEAIKKVHFEWTSIQNITEVSAPESATPDLVKDLQQQKFAIIGLTGRAQEMATLTIHQLSTIGIDLSHTSPSQEELRFKSETTFSKDFSWVTFQKGILFTSRMHKGEALFTLLKMLDYTPKHIIVIDDKNWCLIQVEASCKEKNIPYVGLRYGYLDEKINNFRSDIADRQYAHFKNIPTDKEISISLATTENQEKNK